MSKRKILSASFLSCVFVASSLSAQSLLESANYLPDPSNYASYYTVAEIENAPQLLLTQLFTQEGSNTLAIPPTSVDGYINGLLNDQALIPGFTGMSNEQLQVLGPNIITPSAFVIITTNLNSNQLNSFISSVPPANMTGFLPLLTPSQLSTVVPNIIISNPAVANLVVSDFSANNANIFLNDFLPYVSGSQAQILFNIPNINKIFVTKLSPAAIPSVFFLLTEGEQAKFLPSLSAPQLASLAPLISSPSQLNFFLSNMNDTNAANLPALISNLPLNGLLPLIDAFSATEQQRFIPNFTESQLASISPTITNSTQLTPFLSNSLSQLQLNSFIGTMPSGNLGPILPSLSTQQLAMVIPKMSAEQIDWALNHNIYGMVNYLSNNLSPVQLQEKITGLLSSPVNDPETTIYLIVELPANQSSDVISKLTGPQIDILAKTITTSTQLTPFLNDSLLSPQLAAQNTAVLTSKLLGNNLPSIINALTSSQQKQIAPNLVASQIVSLMNQPQSVVSYPVDIFGDSEGPVWSPNPNVLTSTSSTTLTSNFVNNILPNLSDSAITIFFQNTLGTSPLDVVPSPSIVWLASSLNSQQRSLLSNSTFGQIGALIISSSQLTPFLGDNLSLGQIASLISNVPANNLVSIMGDLTSAQGQQLGLYLTNDQLASLAQTITTPSQLTPFLGTTFSSEKIASLISNVPASNIISIMGGLNSAQGQQLGLYLTNDQLASLAPTITTPSQLTPFLNANLQTSQLNALVNQMLPGYLIPVLTGSGLTSAQQVQVISSISPDLLATIVNAPAQVATYPNGFNGNPDFAVMAPNPIAFTAKMANLIVPNLSNSTVASFLKNALGTPPTAPVPNALLVMFANSLSAPQLRQISNITLGQIGALITSSSQLTPFLGDSLSSGQITSLINNVPPNNLVSIMGDLTSVQGQQLGLYLTNDQLASLAPTITTPSQLIPFLNANLQTSQLNALVNQMLPGYLIPVLTGSGLTSAQQVQVISSISPDLLATIVNAPAQVATYPYGFNGNLYYAVMVPNPIAFTAKMANLIVPNLSNSTVASFLKNALGTPPAAPVPNALLVMFANSLSAPQLRQISNKTLGQIGTLITSSSQLTPFLQDKLSKSQLTNLIGNMSSQSLGPILVDLDNKKNEAQLKTIMPFITPAQKAWIIPHMSDAANIITKYSAQVAPSVTSVKAPTVKAPGDLTDKDFVTGVTSEPSVPSMGNGSGFP